MSKSLIDQLPYYAASIRERLLLFAYQKANPEVCIWKYNSWSGFSQYDAAADSGSSSNIAIEVKYREFTHDKFTTTFIEKPKFNYVRWLSQDFVYDKSQYWNFYIKDFVLEVIDLSDPNLKYIAIRKERAGKDSYQSQTTDNSEVIEIIKDQPAVTYYKFPALDYNAMSIHSLVKRLPHLRSEIEKLNLSKKENYLRRKAKR